MNFSLCVCYHSILLLFRFTVRLAKRHEMKRKLKKSGKMRKCWKKNLSGDLYGFAGSTFRIFRALPSAYRPWVGPQIPKVLSAKPSPGNDFFPISSYQAGTGTWYLRVRVFFWLFCEVGGFKGFFLRILWCSSLSGHHSQNNLAKFGYMLHLKVRGKKEQNPSVFLATFWKLS
jgi:hypothetical protein